MKKFIIASKSSPLARGVAGGTRRGVAKKFIISIMCILCVFGARAANENAATSKEYVDTELATKQPTIPAEGANVVMTFDSNATDGIGTKNIYDPSGSYASQQDALVTAQSANAAVQMAINGEFYCKEYSTIVENDCWLWGIKEPVSPSRNLFDISKVQNQSSATNTTKIVNNGDGSLTVTNRFGDAAIRTRQLLSELAPDMIPNKKYILSFDTTGTGLIVLQNEDSSYGGITAWNNNTSLTITQDMLNRGVVFYAGKQTPSTATISNIQIEEGTVATPYQPYGQNTFIPQNVQ